MEPASQSGGAVRSPRAEETCERLLDAAEVVFAERGFDAATTREIAALSGTNVATPYSYFDGKQGLYQAVVERAIEPLIALMDEFAQQADKPGAALGLIHAVLECLAEHENTTRLVYRELIARGPLAEQLSETLIQPLLDRVCAEIQAGSKVSTEMEPFVASLFVHLSFGYVALAPTLSQAFGVDMLSAESLERQVRVISGAGAASLRSAND